MSSKSVIEEDLLYYKDSITKAVSTGKAVVANFGGTGLGDVAGFIDLFIEAGFDILNPVQCSAAGMNPQQIKGKFKNVNAGIFLTQRGVRTKSWT